MNKITHYINSRVVTVDDSKEIKTFKDVDLYATGSSYISGSSIDEGSYYRVLINSGSELLASLAYDNSDIYVERSTLFYPTYSIQSGITYNTILSRLNPSSSYYFRIQKTSSITYDLNMGLDIYKNVGNILLDSGSVYTISVYSGDLNMNNLYIYDASNNIVFTGSASEGLTYDLTITGSYYNISASISPGAL